MKKRVINMNVLPGEPLDGTGRVCIHLFVRDPDGLFTEPHMMTPVIEDGEKKKRVEFTPTRGRLACNPKRNPAPTTNGNGVTTVTPRTDDPRGVTCFKCMESQEYKQGISQLGE